jgi:hypothetical protein
MTALAPDAPTALAALRAALAAPAAGATTTAGDPAGRWRWTVRRCLGPIGDVLGAPAGGVGGPAADDDGLVARHTGLLRQRGLLLQRLAALSAGVLENPDVDAVRVDVERLAVDVEHHLQRRRDLAWDEVELELGGSE